MCKRMFITINTYKRNVLKPSKYQERRNSKKRVERDVILDIQEEIGDG